MKDLRDIECYALHVSGRSDTARGHLLGMLDIEEDC